MEPRVPGQPPPSPGRLVRAVVVQDEVDVQPGRRLGVDAPEELLELDRTMSAVQFADDRAGLDVERREQRGRAVAAIVEGAPLGLARLHRQQRRGALEGLICGFSSTVNVGDAGAFVYTLNEEPGRLLGERGQVLTETITPANYRSYVAR